MQKTLEFCLSVVIVFKIIICLLHVIVWVYFANKGNGIIRFLSEISFSWTSLQNDYKKKKSVAFLYILLLLKLPEQLPVSCKDSFHAIFFPM